jgi:hypothetical protein
VVNVVDPVLYCPMAPGQGRQSGRSASLGHRFAKATSSWAGTPLGDRNRCGPRQPVLPVPGTPSHRLAEQRWRVAMHSQPHWPPSTPTYPFTRV